MSYTTELEDRLNKEIEKNSKSEKLVKELRKSMTEYIAAVSRQDGGWTGTTLYSGDIETIPEIYLDMKTRQLNKDFETKKKHDEIKAAVKEVLPELLRDRGIFVYEGDKNVDRLKNDPTKA